MSNSNIPAFENVKTPCWLTHPKLKLGEYEVIGGKSDQPQLDATISVSLDKPYSGNRTWPWHENYVQVISYPIENMKVPNKDTFVQLINYLRLKIQEDHMVHIGCFAGHGRTGLVLSALMCEFEGPAGAIEKVRKRYCHKVVESQVQVDFLHEVFGISKVGPSYKHNDATPVLDFKQKEKPKTYPKYNNTYEGKTWPGFNREERIVKSIYYDIDSPLSIFKKAKE